MKEIILICSFTFVGFSMISQESLIKDIMTVQPVTFSMSEMTKGSIDLYQSELDKALLEVDQKLKELEVEFTAEVGGSMDEFNTVLASGNEKEVKAEKSITTTSVYTLSMLLLKNKKAIVNSFNTEMIGQVRKLPAKIANTKEGELKEIILNYKNEFLAEFHANVDVIKSFESTTHLHLEN